MFDYTPAVVVTTAARSEYLEFAGSRARDAGAVILPYGLMPMA